jgi:hypothetical protein
VFQQSSKPASEDQRLGPEGLHLVRVSVHLLIFSIVWGRVLFVGLVFDVMVLRLLLLLSRRVLSHWALRNHQLYLCYMNVQKERGSDSENFGTRITGFGVVVEKI